MSLRKWQEVQELLSKAFLSSDWATGLVELYSYFLLFLQILQGRTGGYRKPFFFFRLITIDSTAFGGLSGGWLATMDDGQLRDHQVIAVPRVGATSDEIRAIWYNGRSHHQEPFYAH